MSLLLKIGIKHQKKLTALLLLCCCFAVTLSIKMANSPRYSNQERDSVLRIYGNRELNGLQKYSRMTRAKHANGWPTRLHSHYQAAYRRFSREERLLSEDELSLPPTDMESDTDVGSDSDSDFEVSRTLPAAPPLPKRTLNDINLNECSEEELKLLEQRIKRRKEDIREEAIKKPSCPVCLEENLKCSPVILSCGHILCCACFFKLRKTECPTCRNSFSNKNVIACTVNDSIGQCKQKLRDRHQLL